MAPYRSFTFRCALNPWYAGAGRPSETMQRGIENWPPQQNIGIPCVSQEGDPGRKSRLNWKVQQESPLNRLEDSSIDWGKAPD